MNAKKRQLDLFGPGQLPERKKPIEYTRTIERLSGYNEDHCWQYDIRLKNLEQDMISHKITMEEMENMKVSDFEFRPVTGMTGKRMLTAFIERHEWLGQLSQCTTHWFGCYYRDRILAGAILFNLPNAVSKMLGEETPQLERLISRGACISWSPKNLASSFLMWCIKWMVKNTQYRLFTAYSDPTAKELGTIYQACNFYYLGQKSGTPIKHVNPYTGKFVSDRWFRVVGAYKKFAKDLGIYWQPHWSKKQQIFWERMPPGVEKKIREYSKFQEKTSQTITVPYKHKYAYVMGRNKEETKRLKKLFEKLNKTYPYPKER